MGKVIAVVDDEIRIRETIKSYLQNEGFDIVEGEDGNSAIQLVKDHSVDLILLDVMMPNMDGFQALRGVRYFSDVIMLTAEIGGN